MNGTSKKNVFAKTIVLTTTVLSIGYAVARYNIFGDVPWKDIPIYILNKGISLASIVLLVVSFSLGPLKDLGITISDRLLGARKVMGIVGLVYVVVHVLMSMSIFNGSYYPNFFLENTRLSLSGGLCLLAGIISFVSLGIYYFSLKENLKRAYRIVEILSKKTIIIATLFFLGVHLFFVGYTGWVAVNDWYGGLPPISLLSFTIFFLGFLINLFGRK